MQLSRLPSPLRRVLSRSLSRSLNRWLLAATAALAVTVAARAEQIPQNPGGEVAVRGNYWRDRNTRVLNPSVDVRQDLPRVTLSAHYLLDAITSASVAAGVSGDQPFTELRHETGFGVEVPVWRRLRIGANYSYSTESDYFSHNAGLRFKTSLFQDNTALLAGVDYGHNTVGKRLGPTGYLVQGTLQTVHFVALATQVLTRTALASLSYEVTVANGYQNNPYRAVFVGGEVRETERLPSARTRHVIALSIHAMLQRESTLNPHVTLRPAMRIHLDSWGMKAFNPEMALSVPVGPVEFRFLFSYYGQGQVDFYRSDDNPNMGYCKDLPRYAAPVEFNGDNVYTSDAKLGNYSTYTGEVSLKWRLSVLRGHSAFVERLSRSALEFTGGLWFADRAVGCQYGIQMPVDDPTMSSCTGGACGAGYANLGWNIPF